MGPIIHPGPSNFRYTLKGKELWGHIDGTDPKPVEDVKACLQMGNQRCPNHDLTSEVCGSPIHPESQTL